MNRAYSTFTIKSVDSEQRIIEGTASTPTTDRDGDVMDPSGVQFTLPMPLLWQHRADQPIGHVIAARVTAAGIQITAQIAKGVLPFIDDAWALISAGLVRGFSVGFKALDAKPIAGGGLRFLKWSWLETSTVTIPANGQALISVIKSLDAAHLAASGTAPGTSRHTSGASDARAVVQVTTRGIPMKTYADQIAAMEATRLQKHSDLEALQAKVSGEGRTKDDAERQQFNDLQGEIKSCDEEIADLRTMDAMNVTKAVAVAGTSVAAASASRAHTPVITVTDNVPPGIGFARSVMCQVHARLDGHNVLDVAKARYPDHSALHNYLTIKATVPAGTTTQSVYAAPLVYAQNLASEFVEFLQPQTILGKFGTGGVPSLTRVPFNVRVPSQTSDGNAEWVAQGAGKPVTSAAFGTVTLTYHKVATIAVLTKELVRLSTPSAELLVRNMLANAIIRKLDDSFIDPSFAAVTGTNPASITNGLVAQSSAGTSADNARTDLGNILQAYLEANQDPTGLVLIMPPTLAMVLSLMRNSLGQKEFQDISANGGTLEGFPVITSQHAANSSGAGNIVVAVKASDIFLADDGVVTIDASEQASVQMSDTPTINSTTGTGASMVSLWQTNSVGIRAEREITWTKARSTAVVYMDDVNWGSVGSPA